MTEFDPSKLGPDELFLSGRLQVEGAINVLEATGMNPRAAQALKAQRAAHELLTTPNAKDDLKVYLQGGTTEAMKADIAMSALLVERDPALPLETRIAATGLLDILGVEK